MERLTRRLSNGDVVAWNPLEYYNYNDFKKVLERLAAYEDTGLTPQEIEQMKARMPLHQWAGESPEKMSIFGVPVSKIMELAKAEKEGRLVILTIQDIHPCRNCGVGWGSISSEGCHSCEETCVRLKEYNDKYNK
jgi:hypothetical protein